MTRPTRDDLAFLASVLVVAVLAAAAGMVFLYVVAVLLALLIGATT